MNVVLCLSKTDDSSEKITNENPYGQWRTSLLLLSRDKIYHTLPGDNILVLSKSNDSLFIKILHCLNVLLTEKGRCFILKKRNN